MQHTHSSPLSSDLVIITAGANYRGSGACAPKFRDLWRHKRFTEARLTNKKKSTDRRMHMKNWRQVFYKKLLDKHEIANS